MNYFDTKPKQGCGFIYKYTSPSGKSYIGQTCRSLKERANGDGSGYVSCTIFFNAIQKYGFKNFQYEILEEVNLSNIDDKEQYYIKKYNTLQPNGYNVQKGGKCDYVNKNKNNSRKTSIIQYDLNGNFIKVFESVSTAAREINSSFQAIEAVLNRTRKQHKGFIYRYIGENSPESVKSIQTHGRQVLQFSLEGNYINTYPSANAAARAIGKDSNAGRNIRSACSGTRQTAYGFKWKYLE